MTLIQHLKTELEMSERKRLRLQRRKLMEAFVPEDNSLWTMLDLITLILVFFIILYAAPGSLSSPDLKKPAGKVRETIRKLVPQAVFTDETTLPGLAKQIRQAMDGTSGFSVKTSRDRVMLTIGERISFDTGRADLLDHIKPSLVKLARFLNRETGFRIIVSGHTDNTPIQTPQFPSNWELSVARALSVAKFIMAFHVDPGRISVQGFGQYRPVADNDAPKSRQANRRVEISLVRET